MLAVIYALCRLCRVSQANPMLSVVMLSVTMLSVIMLSVIMLSVSMLSVIMLSVIAQELRIRDNA